MASLSNINGLFDVHSTGAILFSTSHGTSGQILRSNGNAAPTWVAASTVIGGPYLPLTGGTLSGPLSGTSATFSGTLTVGGNATFSSAVFTGGKLGVGTSDPGAEGYSFAEDLVILGGNSASDGAGITIRNNGKRYSVIAFGNGAGATGNDNDGEIYYDQTNTTMNFRTNSSSIVTFTNVGKVVADTATVTADSANTLTTKGYVDAIDHGVTQITAGTNVTITPVGGTGNVTINANGTVTGTGTATRVAFWSSTNNITSDANLYWDNTNGRLGIHNIAPTYNLQVNKTSQAAPAFMVSGAFYGGPRIQTYGLDADSNAWMGLGTDMSGGAYEHNIYFSDYNSNGRLSIGTYNGTTYSEKMCVLRTGNVGIDKTSPDAPLVVYRTGDVWHTIIGNDTGQLRIGGQTSSGAVIQSRNQTGTARDLYLQRDGGKIGIGTNNPNALLSLGDTVGQKLYVYESGVTRSGFGIDLSGSSRELSIFTSSSNGTTGNISFGYRLESTGAYQERMRLSSSGELNVKGNLMLSVASSFIKTTSGDLYLSPASFNTTLYDGVNPQVFNIYNAGNLAIKLDSVASTYGGVLLNQAGINFVHGYSGYGLVLSHYNVGPSNAIVSGDINNPNTLFINNGSGAWSNVVISGNVGISITDPKTHLHIGPLSGGNATAQERLRLSGDYNGTGSGALLRFTNQHNSGSNPNSGEYNLAGITGFDFRSDWGGALALQTAPNTSAGGTLVNRLVINPEGLVGIGTNDPNALLSLGPTGGQKLYVYESGAVRAGFGVDLSGSSRELSIFHTSSNGIDGDNSFGYRLESTGAYQERMRITGAGAVNIGTTATYSGVRLNVEGEAMGVRTSNSSWGQMYVANPNDGEVGITWGAGGTGRPGGNSTYTRQWIMGLSPFGTGTTKFSLTNKTFAGNPAWTCTDTGLMGIRQVSPAYTLDVTGNVRVTDRLGVGTTPDTAVAGDRLKIQGGNNGLGCIKAISGQYSYAVRIEGSNLSTQLACYSSSTAQTTQINFENPGNSSAGKISTTGNSTAYTTSSDYRLKENVIPISDSISRLNQLKPSRFNFIGESNKTVDGFIAHEVQDIVPEAIVGEKDEIDKDGNPVYQGIDQAKLVPLLVAAIQELEARVKELENK